MKFLCIEKDLQSEIETHRVVYDRLDGTGRKLLGSLTSQEDAVMLQRRLDEMNQRWNNLKSKSIAIRWVCKNTFIISSTWRIFLIIYLILQKSSREQFGTLERFAVVTTRTHWMGYQKRYWIVFSWCWSCAWRCCQFAKAIGKFYLKEMPFLKIKLKKTTKKMATISLVECHLSIPANRSFLLDAISFFARISSGYFICFSFNDPWKKNGWHT